MGVTPAAVERPKGRRRFYLIGGVGFLFTVLILAAVIVFWDELQQAQGYGYVGAFAVSILGGITIIPAPSLAVVFTLGGALNPLYVGLASGIGEAIGGTTVYLTGAGMSTMWTRFFPKDQGFEYQADGPRDIVQPVQFQFWTRGQSFYNRLAGWVGGRGGSWVVFVVSAVPLSPFYFAGLAAGSLRMGLPRFFLVSFAGKTVKGLMVAYAGYWGLNLILKWFGA